MSRNRVTRAAFPDRKANGMLVGKSQPNIRHALRKLNVEVFYDDFTNREMIKTGERVEQMNDAGVMRIFFQLDAFGIKVPKEWFIDCILHLARATRRNPVLEAFNSLVWDGKPRLDGWMVRHAGGEDTAFAREAFTLMMIAGARRLRQPGTKFDQILVFEGAQGTRKSSFLQLLAGGPELFTDALPLGADEKVTIEITDGKFIVELGELRGATQKDLAAVKQFASRQTDRARLSYARFAVEVPRKFTIWGSTNDNEYLTDPTGNRRFWPVKVGYIDLEQAAKDRDQLWAEAAHLESQGYSIELPEALWLEAAEAQRQRVTAEVWEDPIRALIAPHENKSVIVTIAHVLVALGISTDRHTKPMQMRVARCLKDLGFERITLGKECRKVWLRGHKDGAFSLRGNIETRTLEVTREA